jgi:hypothetical protein
MDMTNTTRFLVRSSINPCLVLCTDGEFYSDRTIGPGTDRSARIYKTRRGADAVRGGVGILVRACDERGIER